MALVSVNGRLFAPEDARISVADHGLVVGDGVFETILLRRGRPFALRRHLERLERSAAGLGIGPVPRGELDAAIAGVVASLDPAPAVARLRITLTSGSGPLGSARGAGPVSVIVAAEPEDEDGPPSASRVAVVPWTRNELGALAGLKTTSYAENARALAWAQGRGADEAIFANTAGELCEGTGSNVFFVIDGALSTPGLASGCLAGVTRELLLFVTGAAESTLRIASFGPDRLDEAFLTSTLRGVQPIAEIDGKPFDQVPGPVTAAAALAFAELVEGGTES